MSTIRKQIVVMVDPAVGFNEAQLVREVSMRTIEGVRDWERAAGTGHYPPREQPEFIGRIEIWIDLKRKIARETDAVQV